MKQQGKGYAGRIKNTAGQEVKAPFAQSGGGKKSTIIKGTDLRSGKGKDK